ncbi:MAG: hypothetical protein NVSMB47_17410 [Polyangiales bacterium]
MGYGGIPGYGPPQPPPPGWGAPPYGSPPPPTGGPPTAGAAWSPTEAIQVGLQRLRADPGGILLPLGIALMIESLPTLSTNVGARLGLFPAPASLLDPQALVPAAVANVVGIVARSLLDGGVNRFCLNVVRGRPYALGDVFGEVRLFLPYLALNLIVSMAVGVGMLLLVVPGVILALGWSLAEPLLVDRALGPIDALRESWRLTDGHKGALFVFALLVVGVVLLGACACGVGVFVAVPVVWLARAWIYTRLSGNG